MRLASYSTGSVIAAGLILATAPSVHAMAESGKATAELVGSSIERALTAETQEEQQEAFDAIVALGCPAVSQIVAAMPDRRPLPIPYLRLNNNSPDAFEAFRQYGPETVTDALAAILNQLTGRSFGFIYNGASAEDRQEVVASWQSFVSDTPIAEMCEG